VYRILAGKGFDEIGGNRSVNHADVNHLDQDEQHQERYVRVRSFFGGTVI